MLLPCLYLRGKKSVLETGSVVPLLPHHMAGRGNNSGKCGNNSRENAVLTSEKQRYSLATSGGPIVYVCGLEQGLGYNGVVEAGLWSR